MQGNPIIVMGLMYMFFGIISLILRIRINNKLYINCNSSRTSFRNSENVV